MSDENEWLIKIKVVDYNTGADVFISEETHRLAVPVLVAMISENANYILSDRSVHMSRLSVDFTKRTITFFGEVLA